MGAILFNIGERRIGTDDISLEVVRHRGPERCDVKHFSTSDGLEVSLGGRHYPYTDLTGAGQQPVSYEDGECWVMLDGEIYNHRELRRLLASEGYSFKSESDAEVLAAAYSRWGVKCLKYLRGMFSFCIYHHEQKRFFIARDQLGQKPLYFLNRFRCFRLASEVKQFLSLDDFQPRVNEEMLYFYLATGLTRRGSLTLWREVFELPPGHYVEQSLSGWSPGCPLQAKCWYKLDFTVSDDMDFMETSVEYRQRLTVGVRDQLNHSYPGGLRITGDIGTAALAGLVAEQKKGESQRAYSLSCEGIYPDNLRAVETVARAIRAERHLVEFKSKDFLLEFDRMIYANDFPVEFGRNVFCWMLYGRGNCEGRVILDGEGSGQYLFSNIDCYWAYLNRKMFNESAVEFISDLKHFRSSGQNPWMRVLAGLKGLVFGRGSDLYSQVIKREAQQAQADSLAEILPMEGRDHILETAAREILMHREIIHFLDRCACYGKCELRHPFLDHKLVELSLRMPYRFKISAGLTKHILREACHDVIPRQIVDKPDLADDEFVTGAKWQRKLFHTMLLQNIDDILREPFVERDALAGAMRKFSINQSTFSPVIWRLIAVNRWKKVFNIQKHD